MLWVASVVPITTVCYLQRKATKQKGQYNLRQLCKELRVREKRAIRETLASAQIIFATCVGSDDRGLQVLVGGSQTTERKPFDVVCIDEAAQAMEVCPKVSRNHSSS